MPVPLPPRRPASSQRRSRWAHTTEATRRSASHHQHKLTGLSAIVFAILQVPEFFLVYSVFAILRAPEFFLGSISCTRRAPSLRWGHHDKFHLPSIERDGWFFPVA